MFYTCDARTVRDKCLGAFPRCSDSASPRKTTNTSLYTWKKIHPTTPKVVADYVCTCIQRHSQETRELRASPFHCEHNMVCDQGVPHECSTAGAYFR